MRILACMLAILVSACGPIPPINLCKGAELRRTGYTAIIRTADAYAATGRPVPAEMMLAREGAAMALVVLNRNCPVANAEI